MPIAGKVAAGVAHKRLTAFFRHFRRLIDGRQSQSCCACDDDFAMQAEERCCENVERSSVSRLHAINSRRNFVGLSNGLDRKLDGSCARCDLSP